jgi:hypothetical protein
MNSWDQIDELAKHEDHANSSSTWVRLADDGDKIVGILCGNPYARSTCFVDGKYVPATPELLAKGVKASTRVAINFAVLPGLEVKVLEMGLRGLYRQVQEVRRKYGLDTWAFEIKRCGAAKDPKTTYTVFPERQLTEDERRAVARLELKDLPKLYGDVPAGNAPAGSGKAGGFDEVVDDKTAQELIWALKDFPPDEATRFCERFGVTRIRELPRSLVEKARAHISALKAQYAPAKPAPATERDPFA